VRTPTRQGWRVLLLEGAFCPTWRGEGEILLPRIAGVLDVDGDGALEIVTGQQFYEGRGFAVYRVTDGQAYRLFRSYAGV